MRGMLFTVALVAGILEALPAVLGGGSYTGEFLGQLLLGVGFVFAVGGVPLLLVFAAAYTVTSRFVIKGNANDNAL